MCTQPLSNCVIARSNPEGCTAARMHSHARDAKTHVPVRSARAIHGARRPRARVHACCLRRAGFDARSRALRWGRGWWLRWSSAFSDGGANRGSGVSARRWRPRGRARLGVDSQVAGSGARAWRGHGWPRPEPSQGRGSRASRAPESAAWRCAPSRLPTARTRVRAFCLRPAGFDARSRALRWGQRGGSVLRLRARSGGVVAPFGASVRDGAAPLNAAGRG